MHTQPNLTNAIDARTAAYLTDTGAAWEKVIDSTADKFAFDGIDAIETDETAGKLIGKDDAGNPCISRKNRWDVAQDVIMSPKALHGLRGMYRSARQGENLHLGAVDSWRGRHGEYNVMERYPNVEAFLRHGVDDPLAVEALMPADATDAPGLYVHMELVLQLPELIEQSRVPTTATKLLPMHNFNAPGATDYEYKVTKKRGRAEFTAEFHGRAPDSGRDVLPIRRPLVWMWSGASWSWLDIKHAAQARANGSRLPGLESDMLKIAAENCYILEDLTLHFGQADLGLHGILSPSALTGIQHTPAAKNLSDPNITADEMLTILKDAENRIFLTRFETADTIALGTSDFAAVHRKELSLENGSNITVAKHFIKNVAMHIKQIVWSPMLDYVPEVQAELIEQGYSVAEAQKYAGGINQLPAMLTYRRDPNVLRGIRGVDLQVMPSEQESLRWYTPVLHKTGGLEVKRPRACDITTFPAIP